MDIVKDPLPPIKAVTTKEVRYLIFLRVQMSVVLKFGYGAYYSCYHGWGHGAIGATRSIYEIFLDIKYINKDPAVKDKHFRRFLDHSAEYFYHEMEMLSQLGQEISQEDQDKWTKAYEQLKKKYKNMHEQDVKSGIVKKDATPKYRPYNWAGIDLSQKVKELNLEQSHQFHQFYKYLSNLSHNNPGAMRDAMENSTENQIAVELNLHPSLEHCYFVLIVMFTCITGVLEEYMAYFGIERSHYPNLEKIEEDCKKLLK